MLGQGADLEERLANNKYGRRLIYTPAPVATCACPRSSPCLFRPAPDVTPVRAQTRVSTAMTTPDSPSACARTSCSHRQPCAREEFAPGSTGPRLESAPYRTHLRLFPCIRPEAFAPVPAAVRRFRARSHLSVPFTTRSRPTRSRSY
jgi:hypothetical protein